MNSEQTEMKVKVMIATNFCLKDAVGRRLEGYAALYKTKNRGRGKGKKIQFNSLQMHYTLRQN